MGQRIPAQGIRPGNLVRENRCVLKEHRIGKAGARFETRKLCGVPSERGFFCRADSQGLHPGLVCDAPLGHAIENVVAGLVLTEPHQPDGTRCALGHGRGIGNVIVPLAPTGPRQRDGTRYPLGMDVGSEKKKAVPAGCRNGLGAGGGRRKRVRLYFLAAFFAAFLAAFLAGAALAWARFSSMAA